LRAVALATSASHCPGVSSDANADQQRHHGRGCLHVLHERIGREPRLRSASSLDQRQAAFREVGERAGDAIDALDADGLQIRAEHRLDGSLPTVLDDEVLSQAAAIVERLLREPAVELLG